VTHVIYATTNFPYPAELDQLRKLNALQNHAKPKTIPRPDTGTAGQDWNLRTEMQLDDNRDLYLTLRVSMLLYFTSISSDFHHQECVHDVITKSSLKYNVPWKRQDKILIGNIFRVVRCFFKLYFI
jgi:hypothetical protein